jgi:hypothetical protein
VACENSITPLTSSFVLALMDPNQPQESQKSREIVVEDAHDVAVPDGVEANRGRRTRVGNDASRARAARDVQ